MRACLGLGIFSQGNDSSSAEQCSCNLFKSFDVDGDALWAIGEVLDGREGVADLRREFECTAWLLPKRIELLVSAIEGVRKTSPQIKIILARE